MEQKKTPPYIHHMKFWWVHDGIRWRWLILKLYIIPYKMYKTRHYHRTMSYITQAFPIFFSCLMLRFGPMVFGRSWNQSKGRSDPQGWNNTHNSLVGWTIPTWNICACPAWKLFPHYCVRVFWNWEKHIIETIESCLPLGGFNPVKKILL